ncbi:peptidase C15 [Xanthobacter sp. KR7-65]|uniref:pyroglutamyl-peptidase I family protein n=1 Tax=Xanthobacter sp. KR7-65 TaxID=3156612 RepID=UPI0032B584E4
MAAAHIDQAPVRRPLRILVCAFGPFPGVPVNPSQLAAADLLRLRRPTLAGIALHFEALPTRWDALARLDTRLAELAPDAVLLLGVAARRRRISIEQVAENAARAAPDVARRHPAARRLSATAPGRLVSAVAGSPLAVALRKAGIAAANSQDAGRYLCNASYFHALDWARQRPAAPPVLFVHLPRRNGRPAGVSRALLARGLSAVLIVVAADARRANDHRRKNQAPSTSIRLRP